MSGIGRGIRDVQRYIWGEGDKVEFEVTKGPKGAQVVNVRVVG